MTKLSERVRYLRQALDGGDKPELSQRGFARLCGLHERHIAMIEHEDRVDISGTTAIKITNATGCQLSWLLAGIGDPPTQASVRRFAAKRAREAA